MKLKKYTEKQLREAIATSYSYRNALKLLNVAAYGGNYIVIKKACDFFNISTVHFTGMLWSKGRRLAPRTTCADYFKCDTRINTHTFKLKLLSEGIFEHCCSCCMNTEWLNEPIPLELDHIDGNNKNNKRTNVRLLCPNCHAKTPTYRGKNKKKRLG